MARRNRAIRPAVEGMERREAPSGGVITRPFGTLSPIGVFSKVVPPIPVPLRASGPVAVMIQKPGH
jgi:hypothetical protein